jgi:hypothetical protein
MTEYGKKKCGICGTEFMRYNGNQKYCSAECAKAAKKNWKQAHNYKYRRTYPPREIQCIKCGEVFSGKSNQKICRKCLATRKDCKKYLDARSDRFAIGGAYERGDF